MNNEIRVSVEKINMAYQTFLKTICGEEKKELKESELDKLLDCFPFGTYGGKVKSEIKKQIISLAKKHKDNLEKM